MSQVLNPVSATLRGSSRFALAKKELIAAIVEASSSIQGVRPGSSSAEVTEVFCSTLKSFAKDRGRDLYFPFLASGIGFGPWVELMDGSVKFDMITGIGIHFFGHSHPALMSEVIEGLPGDVMQGNLEPGVEMAELLRALLSRVGSGSRLTRGWLMCSGTMVNEVALKIIRQKRFPATKVLAFKECFAGRSTAMQEITDNPGYRQGQPTYGEVFYLSFYEPSLGLQGSIDRTLREMKEQLNRFPGQFALLMTELVQGEGGFQFAPREFYVRIFEEAKKAGLALWMDEVQTFGRTGELFAYQKFGLNEYVDVVTVGKMLQACALLFTDEYNPKPGLVAGTFSGSTAALRSARKVLELLDEGKFLGGGGQIERLSGQFVHHLEELKANSCKGMVGEIRAIGGMIGFEPFRGTMEDVKAVLMKLFDLGVVAFYCGHGPYLIRMLPPLGAMNENHIGQVCQIIERALIEVNNQRKTEALKEKV
jgi:4-aminobutyrate aminotransferase-like enzyme